MFLDDVINCPSVAHILTILSIKDALDLGIFFLAAHSCSPFAIIEQ